VQHHCRKCGAVVCGPCSSKKFLLPVQSAKPLRVCLTCHDVLTKSKNLGATDSSLRIKNDDFKSDYLKSHFGFLFLEANLNMDSSGDDDDDDDENPANLSSSNEVYIVLT